MLKVINKSSDKRLEIICSQLNKLFESPDFWKDILKRKQNFHLGNINGPILHSLFNDSKLIVNVYSFKSKNPFTKSNGYTTPNSPNDIYLNSRKFNRSDASIAATVAHETIHCLDNSTDPRFYFGHGDNYDSPEKKECAPQFFSEVAYENLAAGVKSNQDLPDSKKYL